MNELDTETHLDRLLKLESIVNQAPQIDCPVKHYFAPGVFAREMFIPKGCVLIGAIHKTENIAILSKGILEFATEHGPVRIYAPHTMLIKPGQKNAAVALEDAVFTNFLHNPTNESDIEKLVELFTESKACELLGGSSNKQLLAQAEMMKVEG